VKLDKKMMKAIDLCSAGGAICVDPWDIKVSPSGPCGVSIFNPWQNSERFAAVNELFIPPREITPE
jgi:hypothetical protein